MAKTESASSKDILATTYLQPAIQFITDVTPVLITNVQKAWSHYKSLPQEYILLFIGFVYCFFGGVFPSLLSAIEAAKHGGIVELGTALNTLSVEALGIVNASKKDDDLDEDADGKKDVTQVDAKALIVRKANLIMTKMNPQKINEALNSIYKVWLAVVATLTLEFAQTVALAMSIGHFLKKPCDRYLSPMIKNALPDKYDKWVPILLGWATKSIAMSIAWSFNSVISAVSSSMVGSLFITRSLIKIANDREMTFNGLIPKDDKNTQIDELASYVFAFMGVWFQFKIQFSLPVIMRLFLWPIEIAEWFIQWSVTGS